MVAGADPLLLPDPADRRWHPAPRRDPADAASPFYVMFPPAARPPLTVSRAPIWRPIAVASGNLFRVHPTKWTHHFGVYAESPAATAGAMMAPALLASRRNRAFAASAVFVTAMAFAGINMWWFVAATTASRGATAGGDRRDQPQLDLILALLRGRSPRSLLPNSATTTSTKTTYQARAGGPFRFTPAPTVAALVVLFMVASRPRGAWVQRDKTDRGPDRTIRAMTGNECALANDVLLAAADPTKGILCPAVGGRPPARRQTSALDRASPNGVPENSCVVVEDHHGENCPQENRCIGE